MGFILLAIAMIIPVIALVFILRTLATIVDGLRSINATTIRMAESLDELTRRTTPSDRL
jgi:uncharacterized protein YoxC